MDGAQDATVSYDPKGRLHQISMDGDTTTFVYDGDSLVAYHGSGVSDSSRRFLHRNHQGSVIAISNNSASSGASVLNDSGDNYLAQAGNSSDTNGNFASADTVNNSVTIDVAIPQFNNHESVRWMAGHESLHNGPELTGQEGRLGHTAYRDSQNPAERTAFRRLKSSKRPNNPDHIMSLVYP